MFRGDDEGFGSLAAYTGKLKSAMTYSELTMPNESVLRGVSKKGNGQGKHV